MGTAYELPITTPQAAQLRPEIEHKLYFLDPPMDITEYSYDEEENVVVAFAPFVIVSASTVMDPPETYIFPASPDGLIADLGELNGSYKGGLDHELALEYAGYEIGYDLPEALREQVLALAAVHASQKELDA